jgi:hypothetical protein
MENTILDEKTTEQSSLTLSPESINYLKESRGWAMFIAILGFIGIGLLFVLALVMIFAGSLMSSQLGFPGGLLGLVYVVMAVMMLFPTLYLFRYAQRIGTACSQNDQAALDDAMLNLKKNLKIRGIYYIIMIAFYFVAIFVAVAFGVTSALR